MHTGDNRMNNNYDLIDLVNNYVDIHYKVNERAVCICKTMHRAKREEEGRENQRTYHVTELQVHHIMWELKVSAAHSNDDLSKELIMAAIVAVYDLGAVIETMGYETGCHIAALLAIAACSQQLKPELEI